MNNRWTNELPIGEKNLVFSRYFERVRNQALPPNLGADSGQEIFLEMKFQNRFFKREKKIENGFASVV